MTIHFPATNALSWNWQIPIGLVLQAQLTSGDLGFNCRYLGMKPEDFLILQMPGRSLLHDTLLPRCELSFRLMLSGQIYGFSSTVLKYTHDPAPLLFVCFPTSFETYNMRKSERIDTIIECQAETEGQTIHGVILDLSTEGCRITVEHLAFSYAQVLQLNTKLQLRFSLETNGPALLVKGTVITLKTDNESSEAGIQFIFEESDLKAHEQITEYIEKALRIHPIA